MNAGVFGRALLACAALAAAGTHLRAQAIRDLAGFSERSIARNDDGSAPIEPIGFTINFFGQRRSMVYVNNNGNITFDSALATYTPFGLDGTQKEIIAAFFADVDTRPEGSALVTYGHATIDGRLAFGANYVNVGYYASHDDKLNRFQIVLIDRSDTGEGNFDIEFNYEKIAWETGDASGGSGGLGGVPAAVGWSNGTGAAGTSYEMDGSLITGAFLDSGPRSLVRGRLNSTVRGRYVFRARDGYVSPGLTITSTCPLPEAALGSAYTQRMTASGVQSNPRWSLINDPGTELPGLALASDGRMSGTPDRAGTYYFTLSLTARTEDGDQTVTRRCSVKITDPVLSLTALSCPLPRGTVGANYSTTLRAQGGTGGYAWSLVNTGTLLPPGLTLDSSGIVSGVPTAAGNYVFTLRAASTTEDNAQPATKACSVQIDPAPLEMAITGASCPLPTATLGVPYTQLLSVSGGTPPYRWTLSNSLPLGITLTQDGRIAGTPTAAGAYPFRMSVADATGQSVSQDCWLVVDPPQLQITSSCPLPAASTGVPYNARVTASGGSGEYTWSVIGSLPPGLAIRSDGRLSGTPTMAGPYLFRLRAEDSRGAPVATACSITVVPAALGISSCPMRDGAVGEAFDQVLTAVGGAEPYSWTYSGSPAPGVSIFSSGHASGTPTQAGAYTFSLAVTDANGQRATQSCSQQIRPKPVKIASACPLSQARVGTPYTTQLESTGGAQPLTWSLIDGSLPQGLSLASSGAITGTPETAGTASFTLRLADAQNGSAVKECSLPVGIPDLPQIRLAELPATIAPASTASATITLSAPYSLPIQGELEVAVEPNTGNNTLPELNRADPRVRFTNGQRQIRFSLPAGARQLAVPLESTGTVAGTITFRFTRLEVAGMALKTLPGSRSFTVARLAPVVTDACFRTSGNTGLELSVTGYTTTRQLTRADVSLTGASGAYAVDLELAAWDWFLTEESQRTGGAFTVRSTFELKGATPSSVSGMSLTVTNAAGTSSSRQASRCQ